VNLVAGASFEVGGGLESRAPEFQSCSFSLRDELVTLIDTPNFDNTERPQTEGLMQIEVFLKKMCVQYISTINMSADVLKFAHDTSGTSRKSDLQVCDCCAHYVEI